MENIQSEPLVLGDDVTFGLGEITLCTSPGTFPITPASRISIEAIGGHKDLLKGVGIDWGSGGGCLSIAAAKIPEVSQVIGLDISIANINIARKNAILNSVQDKTIFIHSDSYKPFSPSELSILDNLRGRIDFILANPPSSENDDGFEFRRIILRGAKEFLSEGGVVFLSISYQYGLLRISQLEKDVPGFVHEGVLSSTEWVPFDLGRPDLLHCLESYVREEARGGLEYTFCNPMQPTEGLNARAALGLYERTEQSPLSRWQTHLFRYLRPRKTCAVWSERSAK